MDSWCRKLMVKPILMHDSWKLTDDGAVPRFASRHGSMRPSGSLYHRQDVGLITSLVCLNSTLPCCSYDLLIDGESKKSGSMLEDFDPAVNPSEEIDDPEDKKPEDWIDSPKRAALNLFLRPLLIVVTPAMLAHYWE